MCVYIVLYGDVLFICYSQAMTMPVPVIVSRSIAARVLKGKKNLNLSSFSMASY